MRGGLTFPDENPKNSSSSEKCHAQMHCEKQYSAHGTPAGPTARGPEYAWCGPVQQLRAVKVQQLRTVKGHQHHSSEGRSLDSSSDRHSLCERLMLDITRSRKGKGGRETPSAPTLLTHTLFSRG